MAFSIFDTSDDRDDEKESSAKMDEKVVLYTPASFDEAQSMADSLKEGHAIVVNLTKLDATQAQRTIDFLTGIAYAINGKIQAVGTRVILCNPKNMDVDGTISLE